MNRRSFISTAGTVAIGSLALPGCALLEPMSGYDRMSEGGMYEFRKGTQPLEIYFFEETEAPREHFQEQAEKYEGMFKADLLSELDYVKKRDPEYVNEWMKQTNGFLDYLSGGQFRLDLQDVKVLIGGNDYKTYDQLMAFDPSIFRMVVTSEFKNNSKYKGACGVYIGRGRFFVDTFEFQIDGKGTKDNTYSPVALHEMLTHGFCGFYESLSKRSTMYVYLSPSFVGLTDKQADFLGWPHTKPIDVHPLVYNIDEKRRELHIRRT
jgi:hypothetical protein